MGRENAIGAPALILALSLLAPIPAEADYRFEDGVYLGPARLMVDWAETLDRVAAEQDALTACIEDRKACAGKLGGVHVVVNRARGLDRDDQIRLVNRYVNNRRYRGDRTDKRETYLSDGPVRLTNRWSTLGEFMTRGGDCEDYATSKYQLLRALDMPAEDLRVVVVYDRSTSEHHAVLAVRQPDGSAWLLDSDGRIHRRHPFGYRFVYALNETSIWDHERNEAAWLDSVKPEEST